MHCNCLHQKPFEENLRARGSALRACWVSETSSTNDDVKTFIKNTDAEVGVALIADHQSAGRGTRGRVWSTPAVSILLTVGVPLPSEVDDFSGLPLLVGAACTDVLREINPEIRLKWPNDLWVKDGKVAGILCEIARNRAQRSHAVVGIGVNICLDKTAIPMTEASIAALLKQRLEAESESLLRIRTAASLCVAIEEVCRCFNLARLSELRMRWLELDAFAGRKVLLNLPSGQALTGTVRGIGARGELLFADASGQVRAYRDARIRPLTTE